MIDLEPHADGTILPVRAHPGARRNEVRGIQDGRLKVCVTAAPEKGKANKALIALLSKSLVLRKSQLELIAGETSHQKRLLVRDIAPEALARLIDDALKRKSNTGQCSTNRVAAGLAPRYFHQGKTDRMDYQLRCEFMGLGY